MLGYESAAEVLALKLPDELYANPRQRGDLQTNYEAIGVIEGVELRWKKKSGEPIVVSLYARALRNARGRVVGYEGMVLDITERKRMEEMLRQSEARYRTVSDLISDYAYAVCIEPDGRTVVEWVAEAFHRMTGFTVQELAEEGGIVRVIHPDDMPSVLQRLGVLLSGQPGVSEHRLITKSGEIRWLQDYSCPEWDMTQGRVVRIIGAGQDITERKQMEAALKASEAKYRTIFAASPDFLYLTDREGKLLEANPALLDWQGMSLEELRHKHFLDFFVGNNREEVVQAFAALQQGHTVRGLEVRARNVRGETREFEVNATPLPAPEGGTVILSVARDITARKQAEERLHLLSRQLLETQESERRHLARELHDEIGQRLTALKINLQALQPIPKRAMPYLQESLRIVDSTVQQIRHLSLDLRPSQLDNLGLVNTLQWYVDWQAQRTGLVVHFAADPLEPRPSPTLETACFRIVQETLTNIARHAQAGQVCVELRQHDAALHLLVRDDGIGFDLGAARMQAAKGKGLGLLGIEERVRLLGGQLEIVTAPGKGTEIRARLPLRNGSAVSDH